MSIRLVTLGVPSLSTSSGIAPALPAHKARFALLVYLAVERNTSRDEVASVFWPEKDDDHARHALSQSLYELKRLLGEGWLQSHGGRLVVPDTVAVDTQEFMRLCDEAAYERAVDLYHGPFLSGFFLSNCKGFETWVERQRAQLERAHRRARRNCVNELVEARRLPAAIEVARRWVELDPFEDEANHRLIELLALSGNRAEALRAFSTYEQRLRDELAIEPLENTRELIKAIRNEPAALSSDTPPPPTDAPTFPRYDLEGETPAPANVIGELFRRRVFRAAAWYSAAVFGGLQSVQALQELLYLPPWILRMAAVLAIAGFPIAVMLSWQFDITADGVRRTHVRAIAGSHKRNWRLAAVGFLLIVFAAVTAMVFPVGRSLLAFSGSTELTCEDGSPAPCVNALPIEPNRIAVLPLQHQGSTAPDLTGELCAAFMSQALARWEADILVADQHRINDAMRALAEDTRLAMPLDTAFAIARAVGAGKLITGTIWTHGDTTVVTARLYDTITERLLEHALARFAAHSGDTKKAFYRLAEALVLQDAGLHVSAPAASAATSFAAIQALDSALAAVYRRDLEAAKRHFRMALDRDPNYSYAHLELSQVMLWQDSTTAEWERHAAAAQAGAAGLEGEDKLLAAGIAALAQRRYGEACAAYREVISRDSQNFDAWYGLSECLARDPTVIRDPNSPSGWSFATSYQEAIHAHMQALYLVPSFNESFRSLASSRLAVLLFTRSSKHRTGVAADRDTLYFAAYAALEADTISLVPYPMQEWATRPVPASNSEVVQRQRRVLSTAALTWAQAFPKNPRALEALALAHELSGAIAPAKSINHSALDALRHARSLESGGSNSLRLQIAEVRMLLKVERFKEARRLARALLRDRGHAEPAEARRLAGIAGLVGEPHKMSALLVQAAPVFQPDQPVTGEQVQVPSALVRAVSQLLAYAYCGVPVDSIRTLNDRAHQELDAYVRPEERELVHAAALDRAAFISYSVLGPEHAHRTHRQVSSLVAIQSLLSRGDTAGVRHALLRLDSTQIGVAPGEMSADGVLVEAQLQLAVRAAAAARQTLDAYLTTLASISPVQFNQPYQPVAIVRMMALRAELAAANGERNIARRWARAVVDLWQDGSPELQPEVKRMRRMARF